MNQENNSNTGSNEAVPAGKWSRALAFLIDGFSVWLGSLVGLIFVGPLIFVHWKQLAADKKAEIITSDQYNELLMNDIIYLVCVVSILPFCYLIIEAINGQTPGKGLTNIAIRKKDGTKAGAFSMILRLLARTVLLPLVPFTVLFSKSGRGLHEKLSGTTAVNHIQSIQSKSEDRLATWNDLGWKRAVSFLIDFPIAVFTSGVAAMAIIIPVNIYVSNTYSPIISICGFIFGISLWYLLLEWIGGRTPGKWVTGTAVRKLDGSRPGLWQLAGRSLTRLIPLEPLSVFISVKRSGQSDVSESSWVPGRWWHDAWSKTEVVEVEDRPWLENSWRDFMVLFSPAPWKRGSLCFELLLYPGIWIPLVLIHGVTIFWLGRAFGAPLLFWHDIWIYSLVAGVFAAMALGWGMLLFFSLSYSAWQERRLALKHKIKGLVSESEWNELKAQNSHETGDYLPSDPHWTNRLYVNFQRKHNRDSSPPGDPLHMLQLRSFFFRSLFTGMTFLIVLVFFLRLIFILHEQFVELVQGKPFLGISFDLEGSIPWLLNQMEYLGSTAESVQYWKAQWWAYPAGVLIGTLLIIGLDHLKFWIPGLAGLLQRGKEDGKRERNLPLWMVLYGTLLLAVVHLVIWFLGDKGGIYLAAPALCIAAGWVMLIYSGIMLLMRKWAGLTFAIGGVLVAVMLLIVGPHFAQNHRYEYTDLGYGKPGENGLVPVRVKHDGAAQEDDPGLYRKYPGYPDEHGWGDPERPLIIICASGGGITAEVWAIQVLENLSKHLNNFTPNVRIVTGASGGMVGASAWVAQRSREGRNHVAEVEELKELSDRCMSDQLSATAHRMALFDLTPFGLGQRFRRGQFSDRGNVLEQLWTKGLGNEKPILPELNTTLKEMAAEEMAGTCPSLIYAPMIAEDGRQLLVSNLNLERLTSVSTSLHNTTYQDRIVTGVEAGTILGHAKVENQPISSWARMSATFPLVTPAGTIVVQPEAPGRESQNLHIVDAGYTDNYGTATAVGWLREYWLRWVKKEGSNAPRKVILIELDAYPRYGDKAWAYPEDISLTEEVGKSFDKIEDIVSKGKGKAPDNKGGGVPPVNTEKNIGEARPRLSLSDIFLEDITSVLSGLSGRGRSTVFRSEQILESFDQTLKEVNGQAEIESNPLEFRTFRLINPVNRVSLSWDLSQSEKDIMEGLSDRMANFLTDSESSILDEILKEKAADTGSGAYAAYTFKQLYELREYWRSQNFGK